MLLLKRQIMDERLVALALICLAGQCFGALPGYTPFHLQNNQYRWYFCLPTPIPTTFPAPWTLAAPCASPPSIPWQMIWGDAGSARGSHLTVELPAPGNRTVIQGTTGTANTLTLENRPAFIPLNPTDTDPPLAGITFWKLVQIWDAASWSYVYQVMSYDGTKCLGGGSATLMQVATCSATPSQYFRVIAA